MVRDVGIGGVFLLSGIEPKGRDLSTFLIWSKP
jgi:hypothetical protein